jgi:hypothetical protein
MNLDGEDKTIILYISLLFLFIVGLSFLISFFSVKTEVNLNLIDLDLIDESNFSFENFNNTNFFEDEIDYGFEYGQIENNLTDSFEFNIFSYDECTPIMDFNKFVKINKRYRFEWDNIEFFVSERHSSSNKGLHKVIINQHINYEGYSQSFQGEHYYDEEGNCLRVFYDFGSEGEYSSSCAGHTFSFVCEEMYEDLNYSGEEIHYTYGKNHIVNVYSNEDESIVLKYGKDIPILFYLKDYTSRRIKIELISLEG